MNGVSVQIAQCDRDDLRRQRSRRGGFSLIELLVTLATIALLVGLLLPTLGAARNTARQTVCLSNQRQLVTAWTMYANTYRDFAMPAASFGEDDGGSGATYWWGRVDTDVDGTTRVEHRAGFIADFVEADLTQKSVFECPAQPWGSYRAQAAQQPTSTYGYNGYYLTPSRTPGWAGVIGARPWRKVVDIRMPTSVFVFADSMISLQGLRNCALLDPPLLYDGNAGWYNNWSPTTSFRHGGNASRVIAGAAVTARADGSVRAVQGEQAWLSAGNTGVIGSVGGATQAALGEHYVPDWREW
jgi:type II secretory pathway pseudopilin PulG